MEENGQYLLSLRRNQDMHVCCSPLAATCLLKAGMGMHFLPAAEVVSITPNPLTAQQLSPSSDLHDGTRCMNSGPQAMSASFCRGCGQLLPGDPCLGPAVPGPGGQPAPGSSAGSLGAAPGGRGPHQQHAARGPRAVAAGGSCRTPLTHTMLSGAFLPDVLPRVDLVMRQEANLDLNSAAAPACLLGQSVVPTKKPCLNALLTALHKCVSVTFCSQACQLGK